MLIIKKQHPKEHTHTGAHALILAEWLSMLSTEGLLGSWLIKWKCNKADRPPCNNSDDQPTAHNCTPESSERQRWCVLVCVRVRVFVCAYVLWQKRCGKDSCLTSNRENKVGFYDYDWNSQFLCCQVVPQRTKSYVQAQIHYNMYTLAYLLSSILKTKKQR